MFTKKEKISSPLILLARDRLDDIFQVDLTHGGDRCRSMRCERRDAIRAVVMAMLVHVCIQADGLVAKLNTDGKAVPLTVEDIVAVAGIGTRRAKRALYDLKNAGLIDVRPRRQSRLACLRRFTRRFWATLGLWKLYYVETVRYRRTTTEALKRASRVHQRQRRAALPCGSDRVSAITANFSSLHITHKRRFLRRCSR